ncbi:hypothetical protein, partial [Vibrio parahaemolyticus]|uniref:hypothetical protein n=2 Tax=Vibrio parahaemolyticus TaxID=670 RepID=UPI001C60951F
HLLKQRKSIALGAISLNSVKNRTTVITMTPNFGKGFPNTPLFIYSNLMRLLFYPVRKISGIKLNIFSRVS